MRIGFISFEYAGIGAGGGIGTYVRQASRMMSARGHDVEVFCGTSNSSSVSHIDGVRVNHVASSLANFPEFVRGPFSERHSSKPFDVIEGPEFGADASGIRADHPEVALVVRLHTPRSVIDDISHSYVPLSSKARFLIGNVRRGVVPQPFWRRDLNKIDPEKSHTLEADLVIAPSTAIRDFGLNEWGIRAERCVIVNNVFDPPTSLLTISQSAMSLTTLFLGRLEVRKGVIELAKAIPLVCREVPSARFLIIGRDLPFPGMKASVGELMSKAYRKVAINVKRTDSVPYDKIPDCFASAAIAIFPSIWESFGYVCLEAMAAGCAVVVSSAGGMAEIVEDGTTGLLVPPRNPKAIAHAILTLLNDPVRRIRMGTAAREKVLRTYSTDVIGPLQEAAYGGAILHARVRNK